MIKKRSLKYLASIYIGLAIMLMGVILPVVPARTALALGEVLSNVPDKTVSPTIALPITDLEVNGSGNDNISVALHTTGGEIWLEESNDVYVDTLEEQGWMFLYGTREDINAALATLTFESEEEGEFIIEGIVIDDADLAYNYQNGHIYQLVAVDGDGITWEEANQAASELTYKGSPGYLATITSLEENTFLSDRFFGKAWMGASDAQEEGEWYWVTGPDEENSTAFWHGDENGTSEPGAFTNWDSDQPDDSDGEDCAQIDFDDFNLWNDLSCDSAKLDYFLVEYGSEGNIPNLPSSSFKITVAQATQEISTCNELFSLTPDNRLDNIVLLNDIDCSGQTVTPLFTDPEYEGADYEFEGVFDGQGKTIKNFVINEPQGSATGIIARTYNATIRNLNVENAQITAQDQGGTIVGIAYGGFTIENVHIRDTIINASGDDDDLDADDIGGLVGSVDGSFNNQGINVHNTSFEGVMDLSSTSSAGGLIGSLYTTTPMSISQSYADAEIIVSQSPYSEFSNEEVGGLIGDIFITGDSGEGLVTITDCYSWSNIEAIDDTEIQRVGGLVGDFYGESYAENIRGTLYISRSYSSGDITGALNVGGLLGASYAIYTGATIVEDSFSMGRVSLNDIESDVAGGVIGSAYYDLDEYFSLDNVYYDVTQTGQEECLHTAIVENGCIAVNQDGNDNNYFINNTTNPPLNNWDFDEIWEAHQNIPPTLQLHANEGDGDEEGPIHNDRDNDGITDSTEDNAPNNGDANNDNIADSEQSNVASFINPQTGKYLVVALSEGCVLTSVGVEAENNDTKDIGYDYNSGLVNFSADCEASSILVSIYQYSVSSDGLTVRKYNPSTKIYFTINGADLQTKTIGGQGAAVATYTIEDNGLLDINPLTGKISDPVGLGTMVIGAPNTGLRRD